MRTAGLVEIGEEHLLGLWCVDEARLVFFHCDSLELAQSIDLPSSPLQVILHGRRLLCLLLDGTVVALALDSGRVSSAAETITRSDNSFQIQHLDAESSRVLALAVDKNDNPHISFSPALDLWTPLPSDFNASGGFLLANERALLWNVHGELFEYAKGRISSACPKDTKPILGDRVLAWSRSTGALRIARFSALVEATLLTEGQLLCSTRLLPRSTDHPTSHHVDKEQLILGLPDGSINVRSLKEYSEGDTGFSLPAGPCAITAVTMWEPLGLLVTGSCLGRLRFWSAPAGNSTDWSLKGDFRNHMGPIITLIPLPRRTPHLLAVAADGGVSVYAAHSESGVLETVRVILPRGGVPLRAIKWAGPVDDFLLLEYSDGILHAWNMQSGRFEGQESPATPEGLADIIGLFLHTHPVPLSHEQCVLRLLDVQVRDCLPTEKDLIKALSTPSFIPRSDVSVKNESLCLGILGARGNLTLLSPKWNKNGLASLSPSLSAHLLLTLVSLSYDSNLDEPSAFSLAEVLTQGLRLHRLQLPSLSVLAKYWMDPSPKVQTAARAIIPAVLDQLSPKLLEGFVEFWLSRMPDAKGADASTGSRSMNRAAILLAIVALYRPGLFEDSLRASVVEALMGLIGGRTLFRPAAIELLGEGLTVWRPFLPSVLGIFRALFSWFAGARGATGAEQDAGLRAAERTLLRFLRDERFVILSPFLTDLTAGRSIPDRLCAFSLFTRLLEESPSTLQDHLLFMMDQCVRMMDPGQPAIRTALHNDFTALLRLFTRVFGCVAWNEERQQLLVGSPDIPSATTGARESALVIFDFKSATRTHTFEGLTQATTAVAFAPDARHIAAYSFGEATIRAWPVHSGLMAILGSSGTRPVRTMVVDPALTDQMLQLRQAQPAALNLARIEWLPDGHCAQIKLADDYCSDPIPLF